MFLMWPLWKQKQNCFQSMLLISTELDICFCFSKSTNQIILMHLLTPVKKRSTRITAL
jgi:hypothetical protein